MSKFIGVKMIEATPMRASMALSAGYKIGNAHPDNIGGLGFVLQWAKYGLKR
nr:MAG: hypothetical protein [Bacteriophage sp.]